MGVKQPSIARIEQADNDPRLSTLKRYVQALGGELSLDVTLPTGIFIMRYILRATKFNLSLIYRNRRKRVGRDKPPLAYRLPDPFAALYSVSAPQDNTT